MTTAFQTFVDYVWYGFLFGFVMYFLGFESGILLRWIDELWTKE